jgi:glycosyltransferase involved in cell wall biosynthesis
MKKTKNELVSIVIATYSSRRTIERCLKSIHAQSYKDIEVIVVDSHEYDSKERKKCKEIITKYAKYLVDGPERSIQRNRGINEARGKYVFIIDQDMYLTKNVVKACVQTIEEGYVALNIPEISIGKGYWTQCVALDRYITTYLEDGMNECCRFARRKDALKIGGFDPSIVGVEDSDFHYRMARLGKIGKIKNHIEHDEGRTKFWGRVKKKYYYSKAFKKYLERYPGIAVGQFSPFKVAYLKHINLLIKKPHITAGIFLLRGIEVAAGGFGMFINRK